MSFVFWLLTHLDLLVCISALTFHYISSLVSISQLYWYFNVIVILEKPHIWPYWLSRTGLSQWYIMGDKVLVIEWNKHVKENGWLLPASCKEVGWLHISRLAGCSPYSFMLSNKGQFPMLLSSWENFMDAVHMFGAVVLSGAVLLLDPWYSWFFFGRCLMCSEKSPTRTWAAGTRSWENSAQRSLALW